MNDPLHHAFLKLAETPSFGFFTTGLPTTATLTTVSLTTESVWECPHWSFFAVHYVNVRACITFQDSLITRYIDFFADVAL